MNSEIYLNSAYAIALPETGGKVPRDRYIEYFNDLYNLYKGDVSPETFMEGSQYTYAELGDALFQNKVGLDQLQALDGIIVAHWSQEFDPDYASCGPYFLNKYQLKADIFDICDQGTIAGFTALKIMMHYHQSDSFKEGMVLCLEQTTIPRDKKYADIIPQESGALALFTSKVKTENSIKLLNIDIIPENELIDNFNIIDEKILDMLSMTRDEIESTSIFIRKSSVVWKIIKNKILSNNTFFREKQFNFLEHKPGCLSALSLLTKRFSAEKNILMIDEDYETLAVAFLHLENRND